MKKNQPFAIKCNDEQFTAYKETLKALGYEVFYLTDEATDMGNGFEGDALISLCGSIARGYVKHWTVKLVFEDIEQFLIWYFSEEESEQQKQVRELEETIKKAQSQIEELKKGVK